MARQAQNERERKLRLRGTQHLANLIRERSGLSAAELEERFGMAGSSFMPAAPGMRWRRYQRGERAMPTEELDRVARQALLEGWLTASPIFVDDLYAYGSVSEPISNHVEPSGPDRIAVQVGRIKWQAWHDHRRVTKERETSRLKVSIRKLDTAISEMESLLGSLDSTGHDCWEVDLPERDREVDVLGTIEPESGEAQYLAMLRELRRVTATLKLSVLEGFAADLIPPRNASCELEG